MLALLLGAPALSQSMVDTASSIAATNADHVIHTPNNSIYVPGGGFSGFWFNIGRLQSIQEPETMDYYCYSAGCLGVVAAILSNKSLEEIIDMAYSVQQQWMAGNITRYEFVPTFVYDYLLPSRAPDPTTEQQAQQEQSLLEGRTNTINMAILPRIHVITTVPGGFMKLKSSVRVPENLEHLREMLVESAWIPWILGEQLWHINSKTGNRHMDGAFSIPDHPVCAHSMELPYDWSLIKDTLNFNINHDDVRRFFRKGIQHGL